MVLTLNFIVNFNKFFAVDLRLMKKYDIGYES